MFFWLFCARVFPKPRTRGGECLIFLPFSSVSSAAFFSLPRLPQRNKHDIPYNPKVRERLEASGHLEPEQQRPSEPDASAAAEKGFEVDDGAGGDI
jgi:hypothetical protein